MVWKIIRNICIGYYIILALLIVWSFVRAYFFTEYPISQPGVDIINWKYMFELLVVVYMNGFAVPTIIVTVFLIVSIIELRRLRNDDVKDMEKGKVE